MKKVIKGYVQAMDGETLWINTTTDEMVTIKVKDKKERWKLYCKEVTITIDYEEETVEIPEPPHHQKVGL